MLRTLSLIVLTVSVWFLLDRSGMFSAEGPEPRAQQTFEEMLREDYSRSIGKKCDWCKNSLWGKGSRKCSGCEVTFCSFECEQKAAEWHVTCSPHPFRPVTTADTLYCAVQRYSLPKDAQTLEDYGFTKVWTRAEKFYLVCVYQTAMHGFRKSPTEIHAWRMSGTLQEHLQRDIAEELTGEGDAWGWFIRNADLFRPPAPSVFPGKSTAREQYSNWKEMPPRILDSIACMRDAVHLNIIPKNPNTLADYNFTRTDQRNHGMLLAVYRVLFVDKGLYPSDILLLRDTGILQNNIVAKMRSPRPRVTPPYVLEWFENNRDIFEDDKPVSMWEVSSGASQGQM